MSQAHIEQFYAKAVRDPALLAKILQGVTTPETFVGNVVAEAGQQGFQFTRAEAEAWIARQQQMKASGELTDAQLEAVAGGKTAVESAVGIAMIQVNAIVITNNVSSAATNTQNTIISYFSTW